ncbi:MULTISPECIES: DNA-processing protein DprA [unclassified Variovorax]|uniref:DNA-processing protein DprA n=1 Tax=unclassified Variovorax TaxID=663243 RepID=UPI000F7F2FA6|nr:MULTISPECIES: DNA-processing protein DprA [unclassified Variovorax]RSZ38434.1 DNA-protecting protein DprA [Variovorax sp. 553]RSZ39114.1 DNA-protecting protein DprA [Variovorax sp. 679]
MERAELAGWLRLSLTPGIGDGAARRLLAAFGLPERIFAQPDAALREVVSHAQAEALMQPPTGLQAQIDLTWQWLQAGDDQVSRRVVTLGDAGYPASLLEMADPPLMLYVLGACDFDLTQLGHSIAVVGSRNPTPQGATNARSFARALGEAGLPVVSGLALGVDGAAHLGALDAAGDVHRLATVAVVGTGLDRVYPARHRDLAHRITLQGLIVSELPLGTPPLTQNFPKRNRLIAGLARGTLVVEAALQSGSLITARLTSEQGKEVFAIPGSIHSPQSRGCHALIRQGAKLVESVGDILEELPPLQAPRIAAAPAPNGASAAPRADNPLLEALGHEPVSLDALGARTGWSAAALQAKMLELELDGHVSRLPGGLFQRVAAT